MELAGTSVGRLSCRYAPAAWPGWDLHTALLSCWLPLGRQTHRDAGSYFRGRLPEGARWLLMRVSLRTEGSDC